MRTTEEIKADMEIAIASHDEKRMKELYREKALFYMRDIPLFRLEAICTAERDGLCVVLPCMVGDTINAFRFSEENGLHIISDKITQVLQTKKGFTIHTKKSFYPIKTEEYDVAPIAEYPNALADFYIGSTEAAEAALGATND